MWAGLRLRVATSEQAHPSQNSRCFVVVFAVLEFAGLRCGRVMGMGRWGYGAGERKVRGAVRNSAVGKSEDSAFSFERCATAKKAKP